MPGFIDLAPQGLAFLRGEPSLARRLRLAAAVAAAAIRIGALGARVGGLASLVPAMTRILVPLLSKPGHRACNQE